MYLAQEDARRSTPPTMYSRCLRKIMRSLLQSSLYVAAGSLSLVLASNSAQALTVQATVNGITYDVTTFTGSYNSDAAKLETLENNGLMPWWGNSSLAAQFAIAASAPFGLPNDYGTLPVFFAYTTQAVPSPPPPPWVVSKMLDSSGSVITPFAEFGPTLTYATATLANSPASVPGPLPFFGAAAAFGMSRRLRRRIQLGR